MTETGARRELIPLQDVSPEEGTAVYITVSQGELISTEFELWIGTWQVGVPGQ